MSLIDSAAPVVLPHALRVMIPPMIGVYVGTRKDASPASIIGLVEPLEPGMAIRRSNAGRGTAEVLSAPGFGYFLIRFTLPRLGPRLERRTAREPRAAAVRVRW